ncbi:Aldo/keto reductase [Wolfiporia cocos MD-104 SS10]|uniref:Aldo/keto reductase n=1 Tax=Wolfiporia cocos (strain MD-104) TaxID=742152 RepID=A0A2H3JLU6_WOLCO|nr:Aldo/keto reductase [Wolfiporia cocos MD-104 SS10]
MPWGSIELNDGTMIPDIAYGTWKLGNGDVTIGRVKQALSVGFTHIDTAQIYRNEKEAGEALRASGLAREDVYITTKYSGRADIDTSIRNSCEYTMWTCTSYTAPDLAVPDIPTLWAKMEQIKANELAKYESSHESIQTLTQSLTYCRSIGVSNFNVQELTTLLTSAKVKPVVNQILFHPYVLRRQAPIVAFGAQHGIVTEAYSVLIPITRQTGGPLDKPLKEIADRLGAQPEQVLLAWAKKKGVVSVTSSTRKERMEGYLKAGDLELTAEDIAAIDTAGLSRH